LERRLQQARRELKAAPDFDVVFVNDNLDQAVAAVSRAIDQEEKPAPPADLQDRVAALLRDLKGTA
jgi:guanylate kinase